MTLRRWARPAAAALATALLASCGSADPEPAPETTPETSVPTTVAATSEPRPPGTAATVTTTIAAPATDEVSRSTVLVADDVNELLRYALAPAQLTGEAIATVDAFFQGQWVVHIEFDSVGAERFDALATANFGNQVAIVIDGEVTSAPTINATEFDGAIVVSGDFDEAAARRLANDLRVDGSRLEFRPVLLSVTADEQGQAELDTFLDTLPE